VVIAGRLSTPLPDAMAGTSGGGVVVAGGESPSGVQQSILRLLPRTAR